MKWNHSSKQGIPIIYIYICIYIYIIGIYIYTWDAATIKGLWVVSLHTRVK